MRIVESCACGATFDAQDTYAAYVRGAAEDWRRDHRCERPCPHVFEQPLSSPDHFCTLCGHTEPVAAPDDRAIEDPDPEEVNGL